MYRVQVIPSYQANYRTQSALKNQVEEQRHQFANAAGLPPTVNVNVALETVTYNTQIAIMIETEAKSKLEDLVSEISKTSDASAKRLVDEGRAVLKETGKSFFTRLKEYAKKALDYGQQAGQVAATWMPIAVQLMQFAKIPG